MHAFLLVLMKPLILFAFGLLLAGVVAGVNRLIPDGRTHRFLNRPMPITMENACGIFALLFIGAIAVLALISRLSS